MALQRISFLSFFILPFFMVSSLYSDDIWHVPLFSQHARNWGNQCIQKMTPRELQLTANLLYLIYVNGLLDTQIQHCFYPLSKLTRTIRNNLMGPSDTNQELFQLRVLVDNITYLNSLRTLYTQMLHSYWEYYEKNKENNMDQAIHTVQSYASEFLSDWVYQYRDTTNILLKELSDTLIESSQYLCVAGRFYKGLSENDYPFLIEKEEEKPFAIFEALLKNEPHATLAIDKAQNTLITTIDHAMNIICLSTHIYKEYYEALRTMMVSHVDSSYTTIVWDAYGMPIPHYEILLPHADHIVEHLHEITKLFLNDSALQN